jgi:hypothetical protein
VIIDLILTEGRESPAVSTKTKKPPSSGRKAAGKW